MHSVNVTTINQWLNELLRPEKFVDYCPNGLQIHGKKNIRKIIVGVTSSLDFLNIAVRQKADAVIVHHGVFWKGNNVISDILKNRIKLCLQNDLNLFAYHLPLDAHPNIGNNVQLGKILEFDIIKKKIDKDSLLMFGKYKKNITMQELNNHITKKLERTSLLIGNPDETVDKISWCTGGAQNKFIEAYNEGANIYITGEISEPVFHIAKELNIGFICAGHHATERYGIKALGLAIKKEFNIEVDFIDINNPI
ncbi:MAG: Nif3-like dinuclear metal center hexameric protein [Candidatus Kinetoplastibacterium crithidii]|nr:Nif3-like dinuclear metal center hexameric protein [Candidatus Kinetoplastibacterium crithidii]